MAKSSDKKRPVSVEQDASSERKKAKRREFFSTHKLDDKPEDDHALNPSLEERKKWKVVEKRSFLPQERIAHVLAIIVEHYLRDKDTLVLRKDVIEFMRLCYKNQFSEAMIYSDVAKLIDDGLIEKQKDKKFSCFKLVNNFKYALDRFGAENENFNAFKSVFELLGVLYPNSDVATCFPCPNENLISSINSSKDIETLPEQAPDVSEWQVVKNKDQFSKKIAKILGIMVENYLCNANRKRRVNEILVYLEAMMPKKMTAEAVRRAYIKKLEKIGLIGKIRAENGYSLATNFKEVLAKLPVDSTDSELYKSVFKLVAGFYPNSQLHQDLASLVSNNPPLDELSSPFSEAEVTPVLQLSVPQKVLVDQPRVMPQTCVVNRPLGCVEQQPFMFSTYPAPQAYMSHNSLWYVGQQPYMPSTYPAPSVYMPNLSSCYVEQQPPMVMPCPVLPYTTNRPSSYVKVSAEPQKSINNSLSMLEGSRFDMPIYVDEIDTKENAPVQQNISMQKELSIEQDIFCSELSDEIFKQLPEESLEEIRDAISHAKLPERQDATPEVTFNESLTIVQKSILPDNRYASFSNKNNKLLSQQENFVSVASSFKL